MKTKNLSNLPVKQIFIMVLPLIFITLAVLPSCAAKRKVPGVQTVVVPSPPPPPPPSPSLKKEVKAEDDDTPFVVVEEMPEFPGGDSLLLKFIAQNTKYPETAKANKIQGRVILRFCVTKDGSVDKITVLKSVDPELDAESVRVAGTLPKFKPGKQGGKVVSVWYMIPITFALN
jgi:TonB family protein